MTTGEVKARFKAIMLHEFERLPSHYDEELHDVVYDDTAKVNELLEVNKVISKALENAEKYRWHDLRKNPEDLPKDGDEVIGCYGQSHKYLIFRYRDDQEWTWEISGCDGEYVPYVIAWREIEPFESEEE